MLSTNIESEVNVLLVSGNPRGLFGVVYPVWLRSSVYGDIPNGIVLGFDQQRARIAH